MHGLKRSGKNFISLRFAENVVLIANLAEELKEILLDLLEKGKEARFFNIGKENSFND